MNDYRRAVKEITDRRRADLDDGLAVWRGALARDKALAQAHADYQQQAILNAQHLPNTLPATREKLYAAARNAGLSREQVEPPCRCKECNDTGYVNGKYCRCVINRVIASNAQNLVLPRTDFAAAQKTAPKAMTKVYAAAAKFVGETDKPFFVLIGSSGTGKTVLASATATAFMERGASVVTVTAFDFVKRAKDYHTQFAIEDYIDLFTPMLDCDVLCIDDLGTEALLKNVTLEYLYTVINERWLRGKYTLVTTNLKPEALLARYGESIFSRLCDVTRAHLFNISAPNERINKKDKK